MTVLIRNAEKDDAIALVMMAQGLARHHNEVASLKLEACEKLIEHEADIARVFIAERLGRIAGFAATHFTFQFQHGAKGLEVQNLFVAPMLRGLGVGHALMAAAGRFALGKDCSRISLGALISNEAARQFYKSLGFVEGNNAGSVIRFYLEHEAIGTMINKIEKMEFIR